MSLDSWRYAGPRGYSADALTNGDFPAFRMENRVVMDVSGLAFILLPRLVEVSMQIHDEIQLRRSGKRGGSVGVGAGPRLGRLRETDPWC